MWLDRGRWWPGSTGETAERRKPYGTEEETSNGRQTYAFELCQKGLVQKHETLLLCVREMSAQTLVF